jgi:NAD(P)-dependent dehydrogenase (short-subunit alcohol dehydrogenase family)
LESRFHVSELLAGKRAMVTGGGTGIGKGIARQLLKNGATVTIVGRRHDVLAATAQEFGAEYDAERIRYLRGDITDEDQTKAAVEAAGGDTGLDIVVANAGGAGGGHAPFLYLGAQAWRDICETNIVGTANTIRAAAWGMRARGGAIIAISSAAAAGPEVCNAHYATSKAAVDMMVRNAAQELGHLNIRVNSIQPGVIKTEIWPVDESTWETADPQLSHVIELTPLGRPGLPEDVGDAVVYLGGPSGEWITGQVFGVDGGLSIPAMANLQGLARGNVGDAVVDDALSPRLSSWK